MVLANLLKDVSFNLFERDVNGWVLRVKYKGCYLLVDNGYLRWSMVVLPTKSPLTQKELHWSEWLESMQKDVKCTFGLLRVGGAF